MSFINSFFEKKFEHAQSLFFDIRFLFFSFTLISSLGFLIIYSFLYGYYFSGNGMFQISNFNIISNLVPFSIQTLTITSIFFICIYYIISAAVPLVRKNKGKKVAVFILLALMIFLLNLAITMFFANEITFPSMLSFSIIWVFVLLVICFLSTIILTEKHPIIMIEGIVFQFFLLPLIGKVLSVLKVLEESTFIELSTIFFIPSLFITIIIFRHYHNKRWFVLISYLPISVIISSLIWLNLTGNKIMFLSKITTFILVLLIMHFSIVMIVELVKLLVKLVKKKRNKKKEIGHSVKVGAETEEQEYAKAKAVENKGAIYKVIFLCYNIFSNKADGILKLAIGLILLFAFVWLPRVSLLSGQSIRMINQSYEKPIKITYVNQSGKESDLFGNYYMENNSTLYIANKCWELEVVKPINYYIKSVNKEDEENKENKEDKENKKMCKNQNWFDLFVK
ncbi:hypothetical protein R1C46_07170 [Bacillus tropicus]|nr:hypothetical protein [Bacillus cereus]